MIPLLRKARGAIGIGVTWGVLWSLIAMLLGLAIAIVNPVSIDPGESVGWVGAIVGLIGFVSGVTFSVLLSLGEGRKGILELSPVRAAVWGALGAAALPLLTTMQDKLVLFVGPLGAAFAAASVAIARRAARQDAERVGDGPGRQQLPSGPRG